MERQPASGALVVTTIRPVCGTPWTLLAVLVQAMPAAAQDPSASTSSAGVVVTHLSPAGPARYRDSALLMGLVKMQLRRGGADLVVEGRGSTAATWIGGTYRREADGFWRIEIEALLPGGGTGRGVGIGTPSEAIATALCEAVDIGCEQRTEQPPDRSPSKTDQPLYVQLGRDADRTRTERFAALLRAEELDVHVLRPSSLDASYRVVMGPFPTREDALRAQAPLNRPSWIFVRDTVQPIRRPAAGPLGTLIVSLSTSGTIWIDGDSVTASDRYTGSLEPGTYAIRVSRPGYGVEERSVTVTPGSTVGVDIVLRPLGVLVIRLVPWARIAIDGDSVASDDRFMTSLEDGSHRIRISREGFAPFDTTVAMAPSDTVYLNLRLQPIGGSW